MIMHNIDKVCYTVMNRTPKNKMYVHNKNNNDNNITWILLTYNNILLHVIFC